MADEASSIPEAANAADAAPPATAAFTPRPKPTREQQRANLKVGSGRVALVPPAEIEAAMVQAKGDRKLAAATLGITVPQLNTRICGYGMTKWAINASKKHPNIVQLGLVAEGDTSVLDPAAKSVGFAYENLLNLSHRILARIKRLEDRLERGEEAKFSTDPEFIKQHAFRTTDSGAPAEERMLLSHLEKLYSEYRMITAEFRNGMTTKFNLDQMKQRRKSSNGGGNRTLPAWPFKSTMATLPAGEESNGTTH